MRSRTRVGGSRASGKPEGEPSRDGSRSRRQREGVRRARAAAAAARRARGRAAAEEAGWTCPRLPPAGRSCPLRCRRTAAAEADRRCPCWPDRCCSRPRCSPPRFSYHCQETAAGSCRQRRNAADSQLSVPALASPCLHTARSVCRCRVPPLAPVSSQPDSAVLDLEERGEDGSGDELIHVSRRHLPQLVERQQLHQRHVALQHTRHAHTGSRQ